MNNHEWICWGSNLSGESDMPAFLKERWVPIDVSIGRHYMCVIYRKLGQSPYLHCWGNDEHGQSSVPVHALDGLTQVSAGDYHTCALGNYENGQPVCFGINSSGQLDFPLITDVITYIATKAESTCYIQFENLTCIGKFKANFSYDPDKRSNMDFLVLGYSHYCFVVGQFYCSGSDEFGQILMPKYLRYPETSLNRLSSYGNHTCATFFNKLICWGQNDAGQINPQTMEISNTYFEAVTGHKHTCAKKYSSLIECWGDDQFDVIKVPSKIINHIYSISASGDYTCIVKNAVISCRGKHEKRLNKVPEEIQNKAEFVKSGYLHSCAIYANVSSIRCWGFKDEELINPPEYLKKAFYILTVDIGYKYTCAVYKIIGVKKQKLSCWGLNVKGSLDLPASTEEVEEFTILSSGLEHVCTRTMPDLELTCWGSNEKAQISIPFNFSKGIRTMAAGYYHTCAAVMGASGCWGSNVNGQADIPQRVKPYLNYLGAGGSHSCGIDQKYHMTCWGSDRYGQLKVVKSMQGKLTIMELGMNHSCIGDYDNIRCFGDNQYGQLELTEMK